VSTLGGNTLVPPYVIADKLDWKIDVSDNRYRALLAATALLSAGGAFIGGSFLQQLVLVLAVGTVGTPFVLALVLYLLNDPTAVPQTSSAVENVGGLLLIGVSTVVAGQWLQRVASGGVTDPVSLAILAFAAVLTVAMVGLLGLSVRNWLGDDTEPTVAAD